MLLFEAKNKLSKYSSKGLVYIDEFGVIYVIKKEGSKVGK